MQKGTSLGGLGMDILLSQETVVVWMLVLG